MLVYWHRVKSLVRIHAQVVTRMEKGVAKVARRDARLHVKMVVRNRENNNC